MHQHIAGRDQRNAGALAHRQQLLQPQRIVQPLQQLDRQPGAAAEQLLSPDRVVAPSCHVDLDIGQRRQQNFAVGQQ